MKTIILSLLTCAMATAQQSQMHQIAVASVRAAGAPAYDDVCLRYGWIRPKNFPTVDDAKQAIHGFHATRVEWFYPGHHYSNGGEPVTKESQAFINWCHKQGMKIGGAINTNTKNKDWVYRNHHIPGLHVGEVNNEGFRKAAIAWGKAQIDAGVDSMVCDDIFKYDKERQDLWNKEVLAKIKGHKPGFAIASNNGGSISTEYVRRFVVEFHYSDNSFIPSPSQFWKASQDHRAHKSTFLLQPNRPRTVAQLRTMIALGYANGSHVIAPWDAYIHGGQRLFSAPSDYADLYGFARALGQAGCLKTHEDAVVGGFDLVEDRYGKLQPISVIGGSGKLSVFGRAIPADPKATLVFHLVDSDQGKSAKLQINKTVAAQLQATKLKCRLLTPPAYDKTTHDKAQDTKNFSALFRSSVIIPKVEDDNLVFDLPALNPWAVLIIAPDVKP